MLSGQQTTHISNRSTPFLQVKGFYNVYQTRDLGEGSKAIMSLAGLGKLSPNMLLMGFKRDWRKEKQELKEYLDTVFAAFDTNLSLGILRVKQGEISMIYSVNGYTQ